MSDAEEPQDDQPDVTEGDIPTRRRVLEARQGIFLEAYSRLGNLSGAARETNILRKSHYDWMADPTYEARFREAEKVAADMLVEEARRRALQGTERPIVSGGQVVTTVREYSDPLLMFLMKGAMPSIYRERFVAPDPDASPLDGGISEEQRQALMDELDALERADTPG